LNCILTFAWFDPSLVRASEVCTLYKHWHACSAQNTSVSVPMAYMISAKNTTIVSMHMKQVSSSLILCQLYIDGFDATERIHTPFGVSLLV
jgi:hypothetical protein